MAIKPSVLLDIIQQNKNKKVLASKIIENNSQLLPILPKLVTNNNNLKPLNSSSFSLNRAALQKLYERVTHVKKNNKYLIKLFPDIELAIQILVSSILSPKNMNDIKINYKIAKSFTLDSAFQAEIVDAIASYVSQNYELEEKLADILREALFGSGAYVVAVIPESSVDEAINQDLMTTYSAESIDAAVTKFIKTAVEPINIIKANPQNTKTTYTSIKNPQDFVGYITQQDFIKITDNYNIFQFSKVKDKLTKKIIKRLIKSNDKVSLESAEKLSYLDIFRPINSQSVQNDLQIIKTGRETKRYSIGKPLFFKIPTEATIPVFIPGDPTNHIGYFVLLDENGKPLNTENTELDFDSLAQTLNVDANAKNLTPVQKAYKNLVYDSTENVSPEALFEIYKNVVENQIYNTIKNSLYGSDVEISQRDDIYFLMFSRALASRKTAIIYLPKELVVYFAFNYNQLGIGKTLLENLSILASLRAIMLFAKVMAYAKQSIDVTKVNISLDPNDPDPEKTIEQIQESVLKLRQNYFPLGINNPVDLVNWIQRAGLQFSYDNNPLIPNVKLDFENANISHTIPSSELEEELRKQTIIALGLSPETVDSGFSPEFATTVVNNNILLSKRVTLYQKTLCKHLKNLIEIIVENDEDLKAIIKKTIADNIENIESSLDDQEKEILNKDKNEFIDYYLEKLLANLIVELPKAENTNITNLSQEFDIYKENLEKVLDSVISDEIFSSSLAESISGNIQDIKNIYKHYFLRKWMADNNYYSELLEITSMDEESVKGIIDLISTHLKTTTANIENLLKTINPNIEQTNSEQSQPIEEEQTDNTESDNTDIEDIPELEDISEDQDTKDTENTKEEK